MNFADHLIDICHEEDHPKIAGHHTGQYKSGWLDGYETATWGASNDDGSYGAKGCKKYY
ncbi:MAG: hypothetical protein WAM14_19830 [Candidatus Nitrosopolaris sp.]